jgi:hypothetical protein
LLFSLGLEIAFEVPVAGKADIKQFLAWISTEAALRSRETNHLGIGGSLLGLKVYSLHVAAEGALYIHLARELELPGQ